MDDQQIQSSIALFVEAMQYKRSASDSSTKDTANEDNSDKQSHEQNKIITDKTAKIVNTLVKKSNNKGKSVSSVKSEAECINVESTDIEDIEVIPDWDAIGKQMQSDDRIAAAESILFALLFCISNAPRNAQGDERINNAIKMYQHTRQNQYNLWNTLMLENALTKKFQLYARQWMCQTGELSRMCKGDPNLQKIIREKTCNTGTFTFWDNLTTCQLLPSTPKKVCDVLNSYEGTVMIIIENQVMISPV